MTLLDLTGVSAQDFPSQALSVFQGGLMGAPGSWRDDSEPALLKAGRILHVGVEGSQILGPSELQSPE